MDDEILGGENVSERTGVPAAADRRLLAERLRYLVAGEDGWPTEGVAAALELACYVADQLGGADATKHRLFFMLALLLAYLDMIYEKGR